MSSSSTTIEDDMPIKREDVDAGLVDTSDLVTGKRVPLTKPGDFLREMLDELGISAYRLAADVGVPKNRITAILNGTRAITADTSIRLGRYFGQSDRYWINLQVDHDVRLAKRETDFGGIRKAG
jgi:addiction module HigA family antidote